MIHDGHLVFGTNVRPPLATLQIGDGGLGGGPVGATYIPLPNNFDILGGGRYSSTLDLKVATDLGIGARKLTAFFRITQSFAGAAANKLAFAVAVSSHPLLEVLPTILVRGERYVTNALTAGVTVQLVIPPLNSYQKIGVQGLRYLSLGFEADVPVSDWTDGAVSAHILVDSEGDTLTRGSNYASGYSV